MAELYPLSALAYTSRATQNLSADDIARIQSTASQTNALDGVTGLLLFTGTHFAQIIECAQTAIEALLLRLKADERHCDIRVRHQADQTAVVSIVGYEACKAIAPL